MVRETAFTAHFQVIDLDYVGGHSPTGQNGATPLIRSPGPEALPHGEGKPPASAVG
jgi:hypothetical protein